jgi:mono/diheme cytochrome c family protein
MHAPVPPEYKSAHIPASAWTNPRLIARGKQIYTERCAVCHGDTGDGKGPAGLALPLKPPDLRDGKMIGEMTGNYWFWRVSEGGNAEPFKSAGSTMPAWKDELSVQDRWAVIVYQHTFSGHEGPHVTSEHPESVIGSHAGHGKDAPATDSTLPGGSPTGSSHGGHRH